MRRRHRDSSKDNNSKDNCVERMGFWKSGKGEKWMDGCLLCYACYTCYAMEKENDKDKDKDKDKR